MGLGCGGQGGADGIFELDQASGLQLAVDERLSLALGKSEPGRGAGGGDGGFGAAAGCGYGPTHAREHENASGDL
jgi:hypothetical protein